LDQVNFHSHRTSTVGLPRLSKICRAFTDWIVTAAMDQSTAIELLSC
jgi:hypothetical protein